NLVKKKRLDSPIAYKVKPINPLQVKKSETKKDNTSSTKLFIEQSIIQETNPVEEKKIVTIPVNPLSASTDIIAKPVVAKNIVATNGTKKSLLDGLRQKYGEQYLI